MNLSIVIPTFNSWTDVLANFSHLAQFDDRLEVIIVDNARDSIRPNRVPDFFKVIHEPKPGSYCARNAGIKTAVGRCIYFTDSDCHVPHETINILLELFENATTVHTGPIIITNQGRKSLITSYDEMFAFDYNAMKKSRTAITANLLVPRFYFDSLGLFNSDTFSGGDVQWTRNYSRYHSLVYLDDLRVLHPARRTLQELKTKARRVVGGRWKTLSVARTTLLVLAPPIRRLQKVLFSNSPLLIKLGLFVLLTLLKLVEILELLRLFVGMPRERL